MWPEVSPLPRSITPRGIKNIWATSSYPQTPLFLYTASGYEGQSGRSVCACVCVGAPSEVTTHGYTPPTNINHTSFAPLIKGVGSELINKDKMGLRESGACVNG